MSFLLKIIIILSALSLDFRTNLTGCYTSSSYVSFNKNLLTMTLHLTQTNNSSCSALSKETAANLTLASDNTPNIMRAQMLNFDYHSTNSIIFQLSHDPNSENYINQNSIQSETMVIVQLYSLSEFTQIEVWRLVEERSALDNCFVNNSNLNLMDRQLKLSILSSKVCASLFSQSGVVIISAVTLEVQNQFYIIDFANFANYHLGGWIVIEILTDSLKILETLLPSARLLFTLKLFDFEYELCHNISQVSIISEGNQYTVQIGYNGQKLFILFPFHDSVNKKISADRQLMLRIEFNSSQNIVTYQKQIALSQMLSSQQYFVDLDCTDNIPSEKKLCTNFIESLHYSQNQVYVDTIFKSEDQINQFYRLPAIVLYSLWSNSSITSISKGFSSTNQVFQIALIPFLQSPVRCKQIESQTLKLHLRKYSAQAMIEVTSKLSFSLIEQSKMQFMCSDFEDYYKCLELLSDFKYDQLIQISLETENQQCVLTAVTQSIIIVNYLYMFVVVGSLGVVFFFSVLAINIFALLGFIQQTKKQKQKH